MELRLVTNDEKIFMVELYKYEKDIREEYNKITFDYYIEEKYKLYIQREDIKFIKKFINESDEIHADIMFDEDNIYRIYSPSFEFDKYDSSVNYIIIKRVNSYEY